MGSSEEQGVLEVAVDRFGVVPPRVEAGEVRIVGWDGPDVLGSVEMPGSVPVVRMEPDRDGAATQTIRQSVVVVSAVGAALVAGTVGADAPERLDDHLAAVRQPPDPDRAILCVERRIRDDHRGPSPPCLRRGRSSRRGGRPSAAACVRPSRLPRHG